LSAPGCIADPAGPGTGTGDGDIAADHDAFISYSSRDEGLAHAVRDALVEAGLACWMAPDSIREGESWAAAIRRGVERSRCLVLVLTGRSNASKQVAREVGLADRFDRRVVTYRAEDVALSDPLEYYLGSTHWLDATGGGLAAHLPRLVDAVRQAAAPADAAGAAPAPPGAPARSRPRRRLGRVLAVAVTVLGALVGAWALIDAGSGETTGGAAGPAAAGLDRLPVFEIGGGPPEALMIGEATPVAFPVTTDAPVDGRVTVSVDLPPGVTTTGGEDVWTRAFDEFGSGQLVEGGLVASGAEDFVLTPRVFVDGRLADTGGASWAVAVLHPRLTAELTAPVTVVLCDPLELGLSVRNDGDAEALVTRLALDPPPEGLALGQGEATIEDLAIPPGAQRRVAFMLRAGATGSYELSAAVEAEHHATLRPRADTRVIAPRLAISLEGPETVWLGRDATYTVTVENRGDAAAAEVRVGVPLPAGTVFVSATHGGVRGAGAVTWPLGDLAPGQRLGIELTLSSREAARVEVGAVARGACGADVESAPWTTTWRGLAALVLEVVDLEDPVPVDGEVSYRITVTNQGSAAARASSLLVDLPASLVFVDADGPTGAQEQGDAVQFAPLDDLGPGASARWSLTCRARDDGPARVKVRLDGAGLEATVVESQTTTVFAPDTASLAVLLGQLVVETSPIEVGTTTAFVLSVTNTGSAPARGLGVVLEIPDGLEPVDASGPTAWDWGGTERRATFELLASLAPKAQARWRLVARATSAGAGTLRARVSAAGLAEQVLRQRIEAFE